MSDAVAQSFGKEKYEKSNLDTAAVIEEQAGWTGIVSYWPVGTKVREKCVVVKLPRVAAELRVSMEVSQNRFVQLGRRLCSRKSIETI